MAKTRETLHALARKKWGICPSQLL